MPSPKQTEESLKRVPAKRTHSISFKLNNSEMKALQLYMKKYQVKNRSKFVRQTVIASILQQLEEDTPTLF